MDFELTNVMTSEDIDSMLHYVSTNKPTYYHQCYNLHDVDKWEGGINKETIPALNRIEDLCPDLKIYSHYFLKYGKDSFTKAHTDNDNIISKTIITLLESKNLIGGETIVFTTYVEKPRPHNAERKGDAQYGKRIIPQVVSMFDGDSIIYDGKLTHMVSQVKQGHRIVLVSWFQNKDK